ncbi:MAG: Cys-Gln thioester bond-forming surface protein [Clostridia bacterium]|nr:Cys-Gln thioester bond-forming surface protein [Clostridia bacterium]
MKKCIKYFLVMFGLMIGFIVNANAVQAATLNMNNSDYWYYRANGDGSNEHSWHFTLYEVDGEVAYCIEPNIPEGTSYSQGSWEQTGLPNSIKERILLIGYYGYTYPGHQTIEFRAATQGLIWDTIVGNGAHTTFWTERWQGGSQFNVSAQQAEIENLIAHHYDRPSFNGGVYRLQVGETLTLTDTNGVLGNYDVSVDGANYNVDGNTLTIVPTKDGAIDITLTKKMPYNSGYKLFIGDGIQNMYVPGTTDPVIAKLRVNSYYGDVELTKKDKETNETKPQGQATLKNAEYGVYEQATGKLVTTIKTDENGYGKSPKVLPYNSYYLQEINASKGYLLDNTKYNFDLKGKENEKLDVFETVVKNYISILKQYEFVDGQTTFLNAEKDITFEIYYPNGDKFDEITTDKNGYATINLPYGVWKFHQVNTTTGYEKIYDFFITVDYNSEKEQYYNILNNALSAYLQVFKTDVETGKTIALANTTFKIYNKDTKQYVSQYVGGKVYSEFKTDENGVFVTYLKLVAGNYKLIETDSPNGYLLDKNGLDFTIGDNTHYAYTTYGPFITVYYKNTPIKGQIEISKSGELFAIDNETFNYNGRKSLEGIVYNIYAEEDIKSADGNHIYFNKGDLVGTMTTNKDGYAISEKLPLGKYIVKEVKTDDEYILDETEYHIELTEVDNLTPIVYDSLEMTNILKKGKIEFTKTDLVNGEVIPNTIIEIYTENNELIFTGTTDEKGKVVVDELKVGKYYILEKEAATGYVITDEIVYFEIKDNGEIVKAEMKNKPITGTVEITKQDISTSEPLPNTLIEVYNDKDELIFSGRTDENGKITIEDLRYGKYYFIEKEAPEGYTLNPERMYFEIQEDGEIVKCTMVDEKVVIEVPSTGVNDYHIIELVGSLIILSGIGVIVYVKKKRK